MRDGAYVFKPLLKTIFLSKDFYSEASYATQVKSPVASRAFSASATVERAHPARSAIVS